jgi:hypothetical protein
VSVIRVITVHMHTQGAESWVSMIQLSVTITITPRPMSPFPCGIIREGVVLQSDCYNVARLSESSELGLLVLNRDIFASRALVRRSDVVGDLLVLGLLEGRLNGMLATARN